MDVTVVIPTHNKQHELRRCLEAVLAQQFDGEFEVLVCDDGSDDATGQMVEEWVVREPRLRYLRQASRGPAAARNLGIRNARAALVAMADDDTIAQPGWLASLCAAAARSGVVGVEGRVTAGRPVGPWEAAPSNESGGVYLTCNALYPRDVLAKVGGFDERFPFAAFEDCDLAARVRRHGEIAWAPEAVVLHPPRPLTWRRRISEQRFWPWLMVVARRYGYLGWPQRPTRHPRARVIWSALAALPLGRFLSALRALSSYPAQALRAALCALAEPWAALFLTVPKLLRFDLESAAFHIDYLNLAPRGARVGIVIVNTRQPEQLIHCVRSFQSIEYSNLQWIVVANSAQDHEVERLRRELPGVEWVVTQDNLGYTGANNLGIQRALDLGCEYLLVMNDDTECLANDFIARLVSFLDLNPIIAEAGPRVYLRQRGNVQNTILRYPSLFRNFFDWFGYRLAPRRYHLSGNRVRTAEMLNGVCILLRAEAIRQVGAFDPWLFMYVEDADLGLRLRSAGWKIVYLPVDSILHLQKESGYELESYVSLLMRRNSAYFLRKHHKPVEAWGFAAANLALSLGRVLTAGSTEKFRRRLAFCRALWREFGVALSLDQSASGAPDGSPRRYPRRNIFEAGG